MTDLGHILAANIKKRRRLLGLSQAKLAEKADTAPTYIAMIELERRSPSLEMAERIAKALEVDPADLFLRAARSSEALEAICQFHTSVLNDFEETLKKRIKEFKKKIKIERPAGSQ